MRQTSHLSLLSALACLTGGAAFAQQPMSAIDWLDTPPAQTDADGGNAPSPVWQQLSDILGDTPQDDEPRGPDTSVPQVVVEPLGGSNPDAVGLLAPSTTGLPLSLWQMSDTDTLIAYLSTLPADPLPALRSLYYTLLLAEADAPSGAGHTARFLQARIDALVAYGAVAQAYALLERAGPSRPQLFDRWLDLSILIGDEAPACMALSQRPDLSNDYTKRIFCAARAGDWPTAALTYEAATAIGAVSGTESTLLASYLDPGLIDTMPDVPLPRHVTPVVFKLFEAAGTPLPTRQLPRAFAMADLRGNSGWKAEIEAAERLTRTRALPANRLLGYYSAHKAAASGGVWDRVDAIQKLDAALQADDAQGIAQILPTAWDYMHGERLGISFAELFGQQLAETNLPGDAGALAFRIGLLSPDYETIADMRAAATDEETFLISLAQGRVRAAFAETPLQVAIAKAFAARGPNPEYNPYLDRGQLGEVILSAARILDEAHTGDLSSIGKALRTLRAVGLEDTARCAALQLLLLEPSV